MVRFRYRARSRVRRKAVLLRVPLTRLRVAGVLLLLAGTVALAPSTAVSAPSISELRAQVAAIQAEVSAIDAQVEAAAEAYNGAVYRLDQIQGRIQANAETLRKAKRELAHAQAVLGARLRASYVQPPPSRIQLILQSGSVSTYLGGAEAMQRASNQDAAIVTQVQNLKDRTIKARAQLLVDRRSANAEVQSRAAQRQTVTALLGRRQAVLNGAKGRLGQMLAAQAARERAAAAAQRRQAQARANAITPTSAPSSPSLGGNPGVASGSGSAANAQAARIALQYLGVPYVWGGATPSGFDCSGLASYAYGKVGKSVPHYTGAIWAAFPKVSGALQPGDLVFFHGLGHMGIYIGGGQMVHAPHTGDVVRIASMASRSGSYVGAVRP